MLLEGTNEFNLGEGFNHTILKEAMTDKGFTFGMMEGFTLIAEGTIKNIVNGRVKSTSAQNLSKICKVLDVPLGKVLGTEEIKKQIEDQGIKDGDASILDLKEIYEHHEVIMKETNEKNIDNIRSNYAQHREDFIENVEKRLADKREIIEAKDAHIKTLEKELLSCKIALCICLVIFFGVLIAELMNPNLGWFRY